MTPVPVVLAEAADEPLDDQEFAQLMRPLQPFETAPHLAVAVSGGADSLALCLLADGWARGRGGQVTVLTVDHGLRSGSADEAARVAGWLGDRGIAHHILTWPGAKPGSAVQAAARQARYALLADWCRRNGVLHLMLGHHRDDQAETVLMRLRKGSGADGLAGMAPDQPTAEVRLLRPLLALPPERLRATLRDAGQVWIEDPSNRETRFERVRLRRDLARSGPLARADVARLADEMSTQRDDLDDAVGDLLLAACDLRPAGYARLRPRVLEAAPKGLAERALARLLASLGGGVYPPRRAKVRRLVSDLRAGGPDWRGATLAGCRLLPAREDLLVCREARGPRPMAARAGRPLWWDRRFLFEFDEGTGEAWVSALGAAGWREIAGEDPQLRQNPLPAPVRRTIPALWDQRGVCAVSHLQYKRRELDTDRVWGVKSVVFRPARPLSGRGFCLAQPAWRTM